MKISTEPALTLLHEVSYGTLATHSVPLPGYPYATAVPYVPDGAHRPVICVSALAEHTKNLGADPRAGFSVLQAGAADVQDAPRLTLVGEAEQFEPTSRFLARFLRYEPGTEQFLALDFSFFRLTPKRIRFIGGVGRMGWLEDAEWAALPQLEEADEARVIQEAETKLRSTVKILGIDCFGIDYRVGGKRRRQRFPNAPLTVQSLLDVAARVAAGLSE